MSIRSFKRAHARRLARETRRLADAKRRGALVAGAALSASALFAASAQAATFTVTNTNDSGVGSLRAAITAANADTSADTITFMPGLTGTITLSTGPLTISGTGGLSITGPGAGSLAVSGGGTSQVFDITALSSPAVSISGLTITDGSAPGSPGGAIDNDASSGAVSLSLINDTISGSTTAHTNGGGGIYSHGPLTLTGSTVSGNTATAGEGGAIRTTTNSGTPKYNVTITNSTIAGNTALSGGGIAGGDAVSISASQITGNHATSASSSQGRGGGIYAYAASLTLTGSTVSGNTSTNAGGGISSETKYGTTISDSAISGNASAAGGGLQITGEFALPGQAAKYNPVRVMDSTISGNQATFGAGVDIKVAGPGTPVKIQASTISGNQGGASSFGGGLLVTGYVYSPVRVVDSTISGNTAADGGGVSLSYGGTERFLGRTGNGSIAFDNSTIASNAAAGHGGGIYLGDYTSGPLVNASGTASIISTIVAGNTAAGAGDDLARAAASTAGGFDGAFSLIETPGNAPLLSNQSVIEGVNPQLGPLANNGGPTQTMLPSGTSPVIDQGHAPKWLTTDQRGDPRTVDVAGIPNPPGGDGTDIGSGELPASSVVVPPVPTAGFTGSIRGRLIGGRTPPLLVGTSTPVACAVRTGTLASCVIEVRAARGTLLASGEVTSTTLARSLSSEVTPTTAGLARLRHNPLGLSATAHVFGDTSQSGSQTVTGSVHLLESPSFTLPLPTRSAKLSKQLRSQLDQVATLLAGAKTITCTVYSDKGKGDVALTKSQAKAICARLVKDGFKGKVKSVGKGHANPIASNSSRKGRTDNRRVVITFSF